MGANPLPGNVFETLANYNPAATFARTQAMQAQADEARARAAAMPAQAQADVQVRQQQAQQLQLQNQAIQLQNQYADKVRDAYTSIDMSAPDAFGQFRQKLTQAGVPGQVYMGAMNDFMGRAKSYAEMNDTQRKGEQYLQDEKGAAYSASLNASADNQQTVWQNTSLPRLTALGEKNLPTQYPGNDFVNSQLDVNNQHGKMLAQVKEQAENTAAQQKNVVATQQQAARELQGMVDQQGNVAPGGYAALQKKYPQASLPATPDPAQIQSFIKGNVPAEERLKFAQADTTNLDPAAIQQRVHAAINPDAITDPQMRARALSEEQSTLSRAINARQLGPEAVQKEIDNGANNIANMQTIITSAKVKAPITISVAAGTEAAKNAAAQQTPGGAEASNLHGQDYLDTLPAGFSAKVKGVVEGRLSPPTGRAAAMGPGAQLMNAVYQADPDFSEQRAQIRKAFVQGADGRNIGNLNTATEHLDQYGEALAALKNGSFQPGNSAYNYFANLFGSAPPTNAAQLGAALSGELAQGLKGVATDAEIRNIHDNLTSASSPEQALGAVKTNLGILGAKLNTYQERYNQQIPGGDKSWSPVLPTAKAVFQKYGINPTAGPGGGNGGGGGGQVPVGATATGTNGHKIIMKADGWHDQQTGAKI